MQESAAVKFGRVMRAFRQLETVYTDTGGTIDMDDGRSAAEEFFTHCYHLKDFLIKDSSTGLSKGEIESHITNEKSLSIAADICNSYKHNGLDRSPRANKRIAKVLRHTSLIPTGGRFVTSGRLAIHFDDGEELDAYELARSCLEAWQRLFDKHDIVLSS